MSLVYLHPISGDITSRDGKLILVHADGGRCHGTPLREHGFTGGYYCPKCLISPDMQSTEFWGPKDVKR